MSEVATTNAEESLDLLLKTIRGSAEATEDSIKKIADQITQQDQPDKLPSFLKELNTNSNTGTGVSLLALKNNAMLSYLNSTALVLLLKLSELRALQEDSGSEETIEQLKQNREKAVNNTIVQRVVLERGVKGLEKKISYQLDKMVRSYTRAAEADKKKQEAKLLRGDDAKDGQKKNAKDAGENEGEDEEDEDEEDEDSDADLNFKPNAFALSAKLNKEKAKAAKPETGAGGASTEKYRPPKISAVAPPVAMGKGPDAGGSTGANRRRKLQSMEEYIKEHGDAPSVEYSVGSNIVDHGRGGVKTSRETAKEEEISRYEEENFTRLPTTATKKTGKEKRKRDETSFFGEDWGMFSSSRSLDPASLRKSRPGSAWDRAKKRRK